MILGIDCSRYLAAEKTGVEIYTDRVLEGILKQADRLGYEEVRLYARNAQQVEQLLFLKDEHKQDSIEVRLIETPALWTLVGLSWEMLVRRVHVLFVPSHTLPLIIPKHCVMTVHGIEALLFPQAYSLFQRLYQRFSLWWAKRKKARFIAVSKAVQKDLLRLIGVEKAAVSVIYNGFRAREPIDESDVQDLKDLVSGDYILHVGRLEERKNQVRLIEAFEGLSKDFPDLQLVLVGGDGYGADKVRDRVEQLDSEWQKKVHVTGYQSWQMVQLLMQKAKVFAYPSLAEGFGIPLLEAFSQGVPVLTSQGTATEEIGGKAVVLCDPLSVESIQQGLEQLLKDAPLRKRLQQEGEKRMASFSWEHCSEETFDLLMADKWLDKAEK